MSFSTPDRKRRRNSSLDGANPHNHKSLDHASLPYSQPSFLATSRSLLSSNHFAQPDITPDLMQNLANKGRPIASELQKAPTEMSWVGTKRSKYRELIDLTEPLSNSPVDLAISKTTGHSMMYSDLEKQADLKVAIALQAKLEESDAYIRHPGISCLPESPHRPLDLASLDDERSQDLARRLQAQFDAETNIATPNQNKAKNLHNPDKNGLLGDSYLRTEDLHAVQIYGDEISSQICQTCGTKILSQMFSLQSHVIRWIETVDHFLYDLICPNCGSRICGGCGRKNGAKGKGKATANSSSHGVCCDGGRLFAIWALLCYSDQQKPPTPKKTARNQGFTRTSRPLPPLPPLPPPDIIPLLNDFNPFSSFPAAQKNSKQNIANSVPAPKSIFAPDSSPASTSFTNVATKGQESSSVTTKRKKLLPIEKAKKALSPKGYSPVSGLSKMPNTSETKAVSPGVDIYSDDGWIEAGDSVDGSAESRLPKGTGYGYGGWVPSSIMGTPDFHNQPLQDDAFARELKAADANMAKLLNALSSLLPDLNHESEFDTNPPPHLRSMLGQSSILNKVGELLRNDSLSDATSRPDLYHQVFNFTQKLALHYTTSSLVFGERDFHNTQVNLYQITIEKAMPRAEKIPSIVACAQNLIMQCKAVTAAFGARQEELEYADAEGMLALCTHAIDLSDIVTVQAPSLNHTDHFTSKCEPWKQWQEQHGIVDLDDEEVLRQHYFRKKASKLQLGRPGRIKRLVEETIALKTSLPPGIFVRHGTSRLDVLKALIIGPDDTPYEGGVFEFDVLCPEDYPYSPPEFQFMTTGGGNAHFNPNLYPCGKVCLSLLNTWAGERWDPSKSTMLQVLVSLQSMIFCENPWYNEPGRESGGYGHAASEKYNHQIQLLTIKHAMLGWLDCTKSSCWSAIVTHHFRCNGPKLLEKVQEWGRKNKSLTASTIQQLTGKIRQIR